MPWGVIGLRAHRVISLSTRSTHCHPLDWTNKSGRVQKSAVLLVHRVPNLLSFSPPHAQISTCHFFSRPHIPHAKSVETLSPVHASIDLDRVKKLRLTQTNFSFCTWFAFIWWKKGNRRVHWEFLRVCPQVWSECKQLWEEGLQAYVRQWWNWLDFIMLSLYLCTFSLRAVAYMQISTGK